jgi:uncharacterized damage-inducible protein DinB
MSNREFCIARRKMERPAFVKVLRALPPGQLAYRPDPKARTAGDLAWFIAAEESALVTLLDTGAIHWKDEKPPTTLDETVATYEQSAAAVDERLARMDEAGWERKARFIYGEDVSFEDTVGQFLWGFLFDTVHHRGQLSTYIRPMGGKVPAIYGPSADDTGS